MIFFVDEKAEEPSYAGSPSKLGRPFRKGSVILSLSLLLSVLALSPITFPFFLCFGGVFYEC